MAVTGYLGLPAEMANIHLRPPTRSAASVRARERASARALGSLLSIYVVPYTPYVRTIPVDRLDTLDTRYSSSS